jgi:hypothetical protein
LNAPKSAKRTQLARNSTGVPGVVAGWADPGVDDCHCSAGTASSFHRRFPGGRPAPLPSPCPLAAPDPVELLFWIIVGIGFTTWYDCRNLHRLSPAIITTVEHAVLRRSPS